MGRMIGEWPLYSMVMASGQMLAATAFQLVLLSGTATQKDLDLYVVGESESFERSPNRDVSSNDHP